MERIIKFRVWASNKENPNGKMYFCEQNSPFLLNLNGDLINATLKEPFVYSTCWARIGNSNINIQQFTGLLDKNGKEIYEGDILVIPDGNPPEYSNSIVIVEFSGSSWCYKDSETKKIKPIYDFVGFDDKDPEAEIIGNIFENPDLLK